MGVYINGKKSTNIVNGSIDDVVIAGTKRVKFGINPSSDGTTDIGAMYWKGADETVNIQLHTGITLPLGEKELRMVYNPSTTDTITKGQAVYTTGVIGGTSTVVSVALALANSSTTSFVLGVAAYDISPQSQGFIVVRGHIENIDTSGYDGSVGNVLYLSATVPGGLTSTIPDSPNLQVRVGRLIVKDSSTGKINIRLSQIYGLENLTDVSITSPSTDQILKYNGSAWVNGAGSVGGGGGDIQFFNCTPVITSRTSPTGLSQDGTAGNGIQINSLSKTPVTSTEQTQVGTANTDTRAFCAWLYDTALSRTTINAGIWNYTTYANVSSTSGGSTTSLQSIMYQVVPGTGTLTITGASANTRLAVITTSQLTGTYYVPNATNTTASYIQATSGTNNGIYQITSKVYHFTVSTATAAVGDTYTNNGQTFTVVKVLSSGTDMYATGTGNPAASGNLARATGSGTNPIVFSAYDTTTAAMITVRTGYSNESTITYNIWNRLFSSPLVAITSTSLLRYDTNVSANAFTVALTDKFGRMNFVSSNASRTLTIYYNGTDHNTYFSTPLITLHNNLAGLDGGSANQYYHLTSDEYQGTGVGTGNFARLSSPDFGGTPTAPTAAIGTNTTQLATTAYVIADRRGMTYSAVSGTTQSAAVNKGYIALDSGQVVVTLPTTASVGDAIGITGYGTGGWKLSQNASQSIKFESSTTTTGVSGSIASITATDAIVVRCAIANNGWVVELANGDLTVA